MSTTVTVSNSLQLAAALKGAATATAPETIVLEAGTYSKVTIYDLNPSANVTIESASASNKAFVQGLQIGNSSNFTFSNINFTSAPGQTGGFVASSTNGTNVNFTNDSFTGPVSTSYVSAPGEGLYVRNSTNSVISGSTFQYVQNGVLEEQNNNITVSGNNFSNIFGDGIDNSGSSNVKISSNSFTNMDIDSSDAQHSDCIQFWTTAQTNAGSNITISGNTYAIGSGNPAQGIFVTDPAGGQMYSNITIENNDMVGTGWNALTLQDVSNALVENNILQSVSSTGQVSRLTLAGGVSGLIENNKIGGLIIRSLTGAQNTATLANNAILSPIPLSLAAQALVSGMASLTSSTSSPSVTSTTTSTTTTTTITGNPHGNGHHAVSL